MHTGNFTRNCRSQSLALSLGGGNAFPTFSRGASELTRNCRSQFLALSLEGERLPLGSNLWFLPTPSSGDTPQRPF